MAKPRSLKADMLRGFLGRCPRCGQGRIFRAFLKVADRCQACGQELFHHRADDFPAYLVIVFVGHLIAAMLLYVEAAHLMSAWAELALFLPLTLLMSIGLLQPTKGAVVALQWHLCMHGFRNKGRAR
jgi:uncharacterized protein (DUF983 family)